MILQCLSDVSLISGAIQAIQVDTGLCEYCGGGEDAEDDDYPEEGPVGVFLLF